MVGKSYRRVRLNKFVDQLVIKNVDIKSFIETTITEIVEGTQGASKLTGKDVAIYSAGSNNQRHVEFDIGVLVQEKQNRGGKGGLKILEVVHLSARGEKENLSSSASRIKFGLRIRNKQKKL